MSCVYLLKDAIYATHSLRVPSLFFTSRLCWWIDARAKAFLYLALGFVFVFNEHFTWSSWVYFDVFVFFLCRRPRKKNVLLYCYSSCEIHSSALCIYLLFYFFISFFLLFSYRVRVFFTFTFFPFLRKPTLLDDCAIRIFIVSKQGM